MRALLYLLVAIGCGSAYSAGLEDCAEKLAPQASDRTPLKVFGLEQRRALGNEESVRHLSELANEDFHRIATTELDFGNGKIKVYPNLNMQLRMTMSCNQACCFCIEQFGTKARSKEDPDRSYINKLRQRLAEFHRQGIKPSVTITGGEPLVRPTRLRQIIETLLQAGVERFNLNTNGVLLLKETALAKFLKGRLPYLNISLHHWDVAKNRELAGNRPALGMSDIPEIRKLVGDGTYASKPRIRLQVVLQKGYVDNIGALEEYLKKAAAAGIDNVSIRGPSVLAVGEYKETEVVNLAEILDNLASAVAHRPGGNWEMIVQNIADWYVYEDWKYFPDPANRKKWIDVHFNFSDMDNIRRYEKAELKTGARYGREFVLFENGDFSSSWNLDDGRIP